MALVENIAATGYRIFRTGLSGSAVPLARRNFVANGRRLVRSLAGIAFAALLMMVELGLQSGFVESSTVCTRSFHPVSETLLGFLKVRMINAEGVS